MMVEAVIVGGTDTTRNQLGCAVALFAEHPEQWKLLAERAGAGAAGGRGGDALLRRRARHRALRQRGHRVPGRAVPGRDVHRPVDGHGQRRRRGVRPTPARSTSPASRPASRS